MSTLGALQKIREQIAGKKASSLCPHCNHPLTIETTEHFRTELCENCLSHTRIDHLEKCCAHPLLSPSRLITAAGTIQIRNQCANCGHVQPNSLGGFTKEQKDNMPEVNQVFKQLRSQNYDLAARKFYDDITNRRIAKANQTREENRQLWFEQYNLYLQSPGWRKKRSKVLERDKYQCQCCLDAMATEVHHKSYEFVDMNGSEPAFDLVGICRACHERIEEMKKVTRQL